MIAWFISSVKDIKVFICARVLWNETFFSPVYKREALNSFYIAMHGALGGTNFVGWLFCFYVESFVCKLPFTFCCFSYN